MMGAERVGSPLHLPAGARAVATTWALGGDVRTSPGGNPVTERRIVVLAFFAFLAVGAAVILVVASRPASHPTIQSGRGASTTQPHPATTSSTTPGTLPGPPAEVKGESATSGTAKPAPAPAPATAPATAPTIATPTAVVPLDAAASPGAPPTTAPPATAPS